MFRCQQNENKLLSNIFFQIEKMSIELFLPEHFTDLIIEFV